MKKTLTVLILACTLLGFMGCIHPNENPNQPNAIVDFTIYPNQLHYYELNYWGGYMYFTSDEQSNSRGIIVYRVSDNEFKAYDRLPPNEPNTCCHDGVCSRLVVDMPFVVDSCNQIRYNILNGEVFDGDGVYPLFQYRTSYDGYALRITN